MSKEREERFDENGAYRLVAMLVSDNIVVVKRSGGRPFVLTMEKWRGLSLVPTTIPSNEGRGYD